MPDTKKIRESLLFTYGTTSRTDYKNGEIQHLEKTTYDPYRVKKKRPRPPFVPLKDLHAMTPWRDPNLPFDLYHKPKEIIRTDPRVIQKRYDPPPDVDRAKVQKSRPEVVMSPALAVDKVEEPKRQIIMKHIYASEATATQRVCVEKANFKDACQAPLSEVYAPSNPLKIEPLLVPYVSPEWRMKSASWDRQQLRVYTEPTKIFWLSRPPNYCQACESSAQAIAMRKRRCT